MEANLHYLLDEIRDLERSVAQQLKDKESDLLYRVHNRTVTFRKEISEKHAALRKSIYRFLREATFMSYVVAPVIYSMIIPAVILDVFVSVYQLVCFPVYGINRVKRVDYISLDRHKLKYLNWIERINCDFCGYFNGVIAYAREVASRTEQYFCPIQHALQTKGLHTRHAQFLPYGEVTDFRGQFTKLRTQVRNSNATDISATQQPQTSIESKPS